MNYSLLFYLLYSASECGGCYGAMSGCCNTCEDVRAAYKAKNWAFNAGLISKCSKGIKYDVWKPE